MVNGNGIDESFNDRLRQAESAEREVQRLEPLAAEAPQLRLQKAKAQKEKERKQAKDESLYKAKNAVQTASDKQNRVPDLLGQAARTVIELYTLLKEIDSSRRQAMEALAVADRVDYDIELEEGEEHERSLDRDTRGLAYALAARHGDTKVKQMLEELDPEFTMLRGCNLDEPLYRDVANFVVRHAVPQEPTPQALMTKTPEPVPGVPVPPFPDQPSNGTNEAAGPDGASGENGAGGPNI
ncbi:MAG: hypothetical protein FI723_11405 [SAR202 cluster bacterium]|nr:hypothetical protein [SAR202 cluster bacterium]|tara:strand:+ start:2001 stop:2720 length:720 start_codon:yes stop_codon:yes gene_type:complete